MNCASSRFVPFSSNFILRTQKNIIEFSRPKKKETKVDDELTKQQLGHGINLQIVRQEIEYHRLYILMQIFPTLTSVCCFRTVDKVERTRATWQIPEPWIEIKKGELLNMTIIKPKFRNAVSSTPERSVSCLKKGTAVGWAPFLLLGYNVFIKISYRSSSPRPACDHFQCLRKSFGPRWTRSNTTSNHTKANVYYNDPCSDHNNVTWRWQKQFFKNQENRFL